jgi:hypothetical protein
MTQVRMRALQGHSTNGADGQPIWHDAGSDYDVDASVVDTLEGIGFATRSDLGPGPVQSDDDHTEPTIGPDPPKPPPPPPPPPGPHPPPPPAKRKR